MEVSKEDLCAARVSGVLSGAITATGHQAGYITKETFYKYLKEPDVIARLQERFSWFPREHVVENGQVNTQLIGRALRNAHTLGKLERTRTQQELVRMAGAPLYSANAVPPSIVPASVASLQSVDSHSVVASQYVQHRTCACCVASAFYRWDWKCYRPGQEVCGPHLRWIHGLLCREMDEVLWHTAA